MSNHLYTPAWSTRLGNLTAKSVLVMLCDAANNEGMSWPSVDSIARDTEINRRTVLRLMAVFGAMGLIERKKAMVSDRYGQRVVSAIYVNLAMLGTDLTEEFAAAYTQARLGGIPLFPFSSITPLGKADEEECLWDTPDGARGTPESVPGTLLSVPGTLPPHPLYGGTVIDPVNEPTSAGAANLDVALEPEQQEHLDRLTARGQETESWRAYYLGQNRKTLIATEAGAADERALKEKYPSQRVAISRVRLECGLAGEDGDELSEVLGRVFQDQEQMGVPVWRVAPRMIEAWKLQRCQGIKLRAKFGPLKFFKDGHWIDPQGWHWNTEAVERAAGASVGSVQ